MGITFAKLHLTATSPADQDCLQIIEGEHFQQLPLYTWVDPIGLCVCPSSLAGC